MTTALIDGDTKRKGKGANKYTAYTYVTDTHKRCSWCEQIKEHSEFHKDSKNIYGKGLAYYCKECALIKARQWHKENINKPEVKRAKRNSWIKAKWGLSIEEYEEKLKNQGCKCAICKKHLDFSGFGTHLDHNHSTGKFRDFLCTNCNRGLGHFQENQGFLMEAIKYLQAHTEDGTQKVGRCL